MDSQDSFAFITSQRRDVEQAQLVLQEMALPVPAASVEQGHVMQQHLLDFYPPPLCPTASSSSILSRAPPQEGPNVDSDSSIESVIMSSVAGRRATKGESTPTKKTKKKHDLALPYEVWSADEIRKECTRRKLRLPSGMNKDQRIEALKRHDASKATFAAKVPGDTVGEITVEGKSVRTKHCMFRLVNVLFSDEFAMRFSRTGDTATREELDNNAINEKSTFWHDVRTAFVEECDVDHERNKLEFNDDDFFAGINPGNARKDHTAKKLFDMWKELNKNYLIAQTRFSTSGQNENEFRKFVQGRGDVLYLRKWLQERKPNLTTFVKGGLKPEDELDTLTTNSASSALATATVTLNKRKHEALESMAAAFKTYVTDRREEGSRVQTDDNLQRRAKILELLAELRRQLVEIDKKKEISNSTELQILEEDQQVLLEERRKVIERLRSTDL